MTLHTEYCGTSTSDFCYALFLVFCTDSLQKERWVLLIYGLYYQPFLMSNSIQDTNGQTPGIEFGAF